LAVKELGSVNRLAEEIQAANDEVSSGCRITRNMLTNILHQPDKVGFTWSNIVALHVYFRNQGCSLQHLPILETRGVIEVLVEAERLVFMYGAKGRRQEQRTDLSWWDHKSFSELQAETALLGRHAMCENAPVLWRSPATPEAIRAEDW